MTTHDALLVTGASGQLGRRVLDLVLEQGATPLIATTRTPEKLADYAARGVDVRAADFTQPEGLAAAFTGAKRILLISTDTLDAPGGRVAQHRNAITAAKAAGVAHVLYTSIVHPEPPTPVAVSPDHWGTEQALRESGLRWTALRNGLYMDLLLMSLPQALGMGQLFSASGNGRAAYVTREDCARAAAAALLNPPEGSQAIDITGPTAVSNDEIAALVNGITGKPLQHVSLTADDLRAGMLQAGLPEMVASLLVSFSVGMAQGKLGPASTAVQDLTGKAPTSVEDFLRSNAAALTAIT